MSTKIEYLYRDGDNYKVHNEAVVSGEYTADIVAGIIATLYEGDNFLPAQVGLPETRFGSWDEQSDGPWFELYASGFSHTESEPTCDITITELANRFQRMSGRWHHALDEDGREIGHSILDDDKPENRTFTVLVTSRSTNSMNVAAAAFDGCGQSNVFIVTEPAGDHDSTLYAAFRVMEEAIRAGLRAHANVIDVDMYHVDALFRMSMGFITKAIPVHVRHVDAVSGNHGDPSRNRLDRARAALDACAGAEK